MPTHFVSGMGLSARVGELEFDINTPLSTSYENMQLAQGHGARNRSVI